MDYAELIRRVPVWMWAQNRDLVAEMPNIVAEAHDQIVNLIDHDFFQTEVDGLTLTRDSGGQLDLAVLVPGILEVRDIVVQLYAGSTHAFPLERRDSTMLAMLYPGPRPGIPRYWTERGGILQIRVAPAPVRDYPMRLTAAVAPAPLAPGNPTNVIGDRASRVMENAALRRAAVFMKDPESEARYEKEMTAGIVELNAQIGRRRRDNAGTRPRDTTNAQGN